MYRCFFKSFYEKNKDKFDKIEADIEGFENQLNHLNDMLNVYKTLLFISKTKEELFENMELIMTRPDGSPLTLTEDAIEFDNSDMGLKEQFERIMSLVNNKIKQ